MSQGKMLERGRSKRKTIQESIVENRTCHCCRSSKPRLILCPKDPTHLWCDVCLDCHCRLTLEELIDNMGDIWPEGCPRCTSFCPCAVCRRKRHVSTKKEKITRTRRVPGPLDWQGHAVRVKSAAESTDPKKGHKAKISPPLYFDFDVFTLELFVKHVIEERTPVILRAATSHLDPKIWTREYLRKNYPDLDMFVRYQGIDSYNLSTFRVLKDQKKKVGWYLDNVECPNFTADPDFEWGNRNSKEGVTTADLVIYAKDFCFGDRIIEWKKDFLEMLPDYLVPAGPHDIIGAIPEEARPVVLMAYMGATGSRTPMHIDKLNSIAFNVHVWGEGVKSWWMVNHNDTQKLRDHLQSRGHTLHTDDCWVNPHVLRELDIRIWEFHQQKGEMVLVPPGVPHEVHNKGGISFAVAANIINESSIPLSWESEQLNRSLHVNSVYKFKAAVYYGIQRELVSYKSDKHIFDRDRLLKFIPVFKVIIEEEEVKDENLRLVKDQDSVPHRRTCDSCKVDIFNRRVQCSECGINPDEGFDICLQCYQLLHFRAHSHRLVLVELFTIESLQEVYEQACLIVESKR